MIGYPHPDNGWTQQNLQQFALQAGSYALRMDSDVQVGDAFGLSPVGQVPAGHKVSITHQLRLLNGTWHLQVLDDAAEAVLSQESYVAGDDPVGVDSPIRTVEWINTTGAAVDIRIRLTTTDNPGGRLFGWPDHWTVTTEQAAPSEPPTITTTTLGPLAVDTAALVELAATGSEPITWAIDDGALPAGLTLSGNTISGTPTTAGPYNVTIRATNAAGSDSAEYSGTVAAAPIPPTITTDSLGAMKVGVAVDIQLTATGDEPITWSAGGQWIDGLTISSGGQLGGAPTDPGNFWPIVIAQNAAGSDHKTFPVTVAAADPDPDPDPDPPSSPDAGALLLLPERVTLTLDDGQHNYRAAVSPLTAQETYELGRNPSSASYRVVLRGPRDGHDINAQTVVTWRGRDYQAVGPALLHTVNGRVHHAEIVIERAAG